MSHIITSTPYAIVAELAVLAFAVYFAWTW